jgi:hypothetical protein
VEEMLIEHDHITGLGLKDVGWRLLGGFTGGS